MVLRFPILSFKNEKQLDILNFTLLDYFLSCLIFPVIHVHVAKFNHILIHANVHGTNPIAQVHINIALSGQTVFYRCYNIT